MPAACTGVGGGVGVGAAPTGGGGGGVVWGQQPVAGGLMAAEQGRVCGQGPRTGQPAAEGQRGGGGAAGVGPQRGPSGLAVPCHGGGPLGAG